MWKIYNKLFGWDYIAWRNTADKGIARVHKEETGRCWYWRYYITKKIDIITDANQVIWLTCVPSKYLHSQNTNETEERA